MRMRCRARCSRGNPEEKIAVIPIEGVIHQGTYEWVSKWIATVEKDPHVKAVVLAVDSPGGGVTRFR